jgi:hypothetical protein
MTPRISVAGAVSITTEVLGAWLFLDKDGDQLNFFQPIRKGVAL